MFGAGAGIGGPLGGYISDNFGWRSAFLVQIPFLVFASTLVFVHVNIKLPRTPLTPIEKLKRVDWLGSLTLVAFVVPLLAGFSLKATEDLDWSDARVWGLLATSGVGLFAFIFVEAKVSPEPVMPMRLILSRTALASSLTNLWVLSNRSQHGLTLALS
jgi:MFS family permease